MHFVEFCVLARAVFWLGVAPPGDHVSHVSPCGDIWWSHRVMGLGLLWHPCPMIPTTCCWSLADKPRSPHVSCVMVAARANSAQFWGKRTAYCTTNIKTNASGLKKMSCSVSEFYWQFSGKDILVRVETRTPTLFCCYLCDDVDVTKPILSSGYGLAGWPWPGPGWCSVTSNIRVRPGVFWWPGTKESWDNMDKSNQTIMDIFAKIHSKYYHAFMKLKFEFYCHNFGG